MTVLVTGGSGLVGGHVIRALRQEGTPVRALVRPASRHHVEGPGVEVVEGDVTDEPSWRRAARGVSGIIHSAALIAQRGTWSDFSKVNVGGTRLAVAAARAARVRLVHISSVAVYGRGNAYAAGAGGVDEEFRFGSIDGHDYYAHSKRESEQVVWDAVQAGVDAVALRPNVIYGEGDRLFSPRVLAAIRHGVVPQVGAGTNHLSCVYAGNVAAAALLALRTPAARGRVFNTTDDGPERHTQRGFSDAFADALGIRVRRVRLPYPVARVAVDLWARWLMIRSPGRYSGVGASAVRFLAEENPFVSERARQELGWRPVTSPREAVRRTVNWLLENEKPGPEPGL
ncbi:MAG TPA: NAD-dependent epimerase/dehydratase family protein [Gemmatimonadales bacterium]|nr:NAD-dependent epimerase/dehydratase family protein [Gemmatimonadales bacterium]